MFIIKSPLLWIHTNQYHLNKTGVGKTQKFATLLACNVNKQLAKRERERLNVLHKYFSPIKLLELPRRLLPCLERLERSIRPGWMFFTSLCLIKLLELPHQLLPWFDWDISCNSKVGQAQNLKYVQPWFTKDRRTISDCYQWFQIDFNHHFNICWSSIDFVQG